MSTTERLLLIVDDDPGLLRQLRWAFSDHKVYAASTRQEAADLVRKDPVPVAIVDLGLPPDPDGASEGLAILADILAIAPATKVIIATGTKHANTPCKRLRRRLRLLPKAYLYRRATTNRRAR